MTSDLTGGQTSVEGSNYAFNVDSDTPVYVTSEGVKLATVTFTVNGNFEGESTSVDVSLAEAEITRDQAAPPRGQYHCSRLRYPLPHLHRDLHRR